MVTSLIDFLSMEVESWKFQVWVTWLEAWYLENIWLASILRAALLPQPVASALTPQIRYQKSVDRGWPVGCFKLDAWWRNHIFGVRRNRLTQTHPPLWFEGSGESWGEVCSDHKTLDLETLTGSLYCWAPSQSIVYQISCGMTICCPDLATHMLLSWPSHLPFPHLNKGNISFGTGFQKSGTGLH